MLVLSRRVKESIIIETPEGKKIRILIIAIGDRVRLGFEADKDVIIYRDEVAKLVNLKERDPPD